MKSSASSSLLQNDMMAAQQDEMQAEAQVEDFEVSHPGIQQCVSEDAINGPKLVKKKDERVKYKKQYLELRKRLFEVSIFYDICYMTFI